MTDSASATRPSGNAPDNLADLEFTLVQLREAFRLETSQLQARWTDDNPSVGHCHVVSAIINERHSGRILRGYTRANDLHYWNVVSGITIDATRDQFLAGTVFDRIEDATDEVLDARTMLKRDLLAARAFGPTG